MTPALLADALWWTGATIALLCFATLFLGDR